MENINSVPEFFDGENISEQEGFSFSQIVLGQVKKITNLMSEDLSVDTPEIIKKSKLTSELRDSGNKKIKLIKSVEVLDRLLKPHYNKKMEDEKEIIDKRIEDVRERIYNDFIMWFNNKETNIYYAERDKIKLLLKYNQIPEDSPLYKLGIELLVEIYEDLFQALCNLLYDRDYLAEVQYGE